MHVSDTNSIAPHLLEGGPNGATFPGIRIRKGKCKGKFSLAFTAYLVNPATGQALLEEECTIM